MVQFLVQSSHIFRVVTRDIGGSDPERMAAPRVVEYLQEVYKDTVIKVIKAFNLINNHDFFNNSKQKTDQLHCFCVFEVM